MNFPSYLWKVAFMYGIQIRNSSGTHDLSQNSIFRKVWSHTQTITGGSGRRDFSLTATPSYSANLAGGSYVFVAVTYGLTTNISGKWNSAWVDDSASSSSLNVYTTFPATLPIKLSLIKDDSVTGQVLVTLYMVEI